MAISLKKALSAYDRLDTVVVDCGGGWQCTIRSFASVTKEFATEQARIRAAGGLSKKNLSTQSAAYLTKDGSVVMNAENPYLLGSLEADVDFLVHHILVTWSGLHDDDGNIVNYGIDVAKQLFLTNGAAGERLYNELMLAALNNENFVKAITQQAEEDGKN